MEGFEIFIYLFVYLFWVKFFSMIVMHFIWTGLENFVMGMCCFWVGRLGLRFQLQFDSDEFRRKNKKKIIELNFVP